MGGGHEWIYEYDLHNLFPEGSRPRALVISDPGPKWPPQSISLPDVDGRPVGDLGFTI